MPIASQTIYERPAKGAPMLRVLRASRVAPPANPAHDDAVAAAFADVLRRTPRALRLEVQAFSRDADRRAAFGAALARAGFRPADAPNDYTHTIAVALGRPDDEVLASFDRSARRNIRELAKHPVEIRPITDPALADRLTALHLETVARTGGASPAPDWDEPIRTTADTPDRSRFVGIFARDLDGPAALLAYAWGVHRGDRAEYVHGGSTRDTPHRIALAYPLLWDLIAWANAHGATWFDMGGVTMGTRADVNDPLGGISDFKRFFSRDVVHVADDWVLDATTAPARLARAARRMLGR
jgi:hypothetical protein